MTGYTITYINNTTQVSTTAFPQPTDTTWPITGLDENTSYDISISATCSNSDSLEETISQTTAITQVYGCMDSQAWNFAGVGNTNGLPVANAEDGTCIYEGCIDSTSLNGITTFNHPNPGTFYTNPINATIQDNPSTCVAIVNGCTDATAFNYDEDANVDDGSCVAEVLGCTDDSLNNSGTTAATNYNSSANVDDGSCTYIYPTLYNAVPLGMQAPLLNTVGWTTTTLWSGTSRVVFCCLGR